MLDQKRLIEKYNVPVPRYTSYPPANFFYETFGAEQYKKAVIESNSQIPGHISFYIHIPYCFQLCHYCGCNAFLLRNKKDLRLYVETLKKEISLLLPLLDKKRKISQIHYGGGSPTCLPVPDLRSINDLLLSNFETVGNPEIAIECHPGYMDRQYWIELAGAGFNRVSVGVQDFSENVLKAVHRKPSKVPIDEIMEVLRKNDISVNMDFIYGLPMQTIDSFSETMKEAIRLKPDRLVTFSYAHVPWVNIRQKELEKVGFPGINDKHSMYGAAYKQLIDGGYKSVGLDHFVLPQDELYIAQSNKTLHRNFQGYCTKRTTGQVYALGVTGISQLNAAYSQNIKDIDAYVKAIWEGCFPVFKGYELSWEEQVTRFVITSLMCNYELNWNTIASEMNISINDVKSCLNYDEVALQSFANDGIIEFDSGLIKMLPDAKPFVRNVAASLDKKMKFFLGQVYSKVE